MWLQDVACAPRPDNTVTPDLPSCGSSVPAFTTPGRDGGGVGGGRGLPCGVRQNSEFCGLPGGAASSADADTGQEPLPPGMRPVLKAQQG